MVVADTCEGATRGEVILTQSYLTPSKGVALHALFLIEFSSSFE